jgi:hypothetical protein
MRPRLLGIVFAGVMISVSNACAQSAPQGRDSAAAARQFVQGFYSWDTSLTESQRSSEVAKVSSYLDSSLASGFHSAREKIDFDPFLASQDPCPRYKVTKIRVEGLGFRVTVEPVCRTPEVQRWQADSKADVEVIPVAGQWRIDNLFYDTGGHRVDLKSLLTGTQPRENLRDGGIVSAVPEH